MWQELREELHPSGFELVTVSLDATAGKWSRRWIEAAQPRHPSLIDATHSVDRLFGIVNVPSGVWIDESGAIVRPAETAHPGVAVFSTLPRPESLTEYQEQTLEVSRGIRAHPRRYAAALRDWVANGAASRFVMSPEQVRERAGGRSHEEALAAAHFELGSHLLGGDRPEAAIPHFRAAHQLQPDNWTYKRQAWSLVRADQGPTDVYESDFLSEVRRVGPENFYRPLDM